MSKQYEQNLVEVKAISENQLSVLLNEIGTNDINTIITELNNDRTQELEQCFVPGNTGIFINKEILDMLNNPRHIRPTDDLSHSKLLYYGQGDFSGLHFADSSSVSKQKLTHLQATDLRIWNYLSLVLLSDYSKKRWGKLQDDKGKNIDRIFIDRYSHEAMSRHSISRLYWSAKICDTSEDRTSINEPDQESTHLTNVLWTNQDFMGNIMELKFASNIKFVQWFLEFCCQSENNVKIFRDNNYDKMKRLLASDNNVFIYGTMNKDEAFELFDHNLASLIS